MADNFICIECISHEARPFYWFTVAYHDWENVLAKFNDQGGEFEYEIVDAEGPAQSILLECSASQAFEVGKFLEEHVDNHLDTYVCEIAGISNFLSNMEEVAQSAVETFECVVEKREDYAYQFLEDRYGTLPTFVERYIDYESLLRDLEIDSVYIVEVGREFHIVWRRA